MANIIVTYRASEKEKEWYKSFFKNHNLAFLHDFPDITAQEKALLNYDIVIAWNPTTELKMFPKETFQHFKFMQLLSAGYDHLNFEMFPQSCVIAANQGAYAIPMAEHTIAMLLACVKKLRAYHATLSAGKFEQLNSFTKPIHGSTLGIIGFGSIGKETARLMKPFQVKIIALNTSGLTTEPVDFIGTLKDLDYLLRHSDYVVVSIPLTTATEALIGKRELELMKNDAVFINVARGPIIKEKDLYEHLKTHPDFYAAIDAWWIEPFKFGEFKIHYPFFELPNLLGSPHNSALVKGWELEGAKKTAENVARYLNNQQVKGIISRE